MFDKTECRKMLIKWRARRFCCSVALHNEYTRREVYTSSFPLEKCLSCFFSSGLKNMCTPEEQHRINIEPDHGCLEDYFPVRGGIHSQVLVLDLF